MTREQIEKYEELRGAKIELESLIDATQDQYFEGFAAVINPMLPSTILPDGRIYRYATSQYLMDNIVMFLRAELSRVNHLIEQL